MRLTIFFGRFCVRRKAANFLVNCPSRWSLYLSLAIYVDHIPPSATLEWSGWIPLRLLPLLQHLWCWKILFNIRFLQLNIFRNGIWVPWIISPVAPPGEQKIRVIVSAQHTEDDIKRALDHFKDAKKLLKREKIWVIKTVHGFQNTVLN